MWQKCDANKMKWDIQGWKCDTKTGKCDKNVTRNLKNETQKVENVTKMWHKCDTNVSTLFLIWNFLHTILHTFYKNTSRKTFEQSAALNMTKIKTF